MKTIKLNHIYDYYPLYTITYGRELDVKAYEALNAVRSAEDFFVSNEQTPLRILELFAGHSEHKDHFLRACAVPIETYKGLDNQPHAKSADVVVADAITGNYPGFNFIIAYYHSLTTAVYRKTMVGSYVRHVHDRETLLDFFKNVGRNFRSTKLSGKKAFWFNVSSFNCPFSEALHAPVSEDWEYRVPFGHALRADFGIAPFVAAVVRGTTNRQYNRITSTLEEHLTNFGLYVGKRKIVGWSIRQPFTNRFWSDSEITDALLEAGFSGIQYYNNKQVDGNDPERRLLSPIVKATPDIEDVDDDDFLPTDIMAIFCPPGY